jgi:hypothetical protein
LAFNIFQGFLFGPGLTIGPVGCQRIIDIHQGK